MRRSCCNRIHLHNAKCDVNVNSHINKRKCCLLGYLQRNDGDGGLGGGVQKTPDMFQPS